MRQLKLGVIGLSEGNGHPYSWSAIFNGYNTEAMQSCPFPVIPVYLAKQKFPEAKLENANVTHIWTQSLSMSQHVAQASLIPNICANLEDMIGQVDAVLLARDDAENHLLMAEPFIKAGLPIYIDKPLAYTLKEARRIYDMQQYPGQIFTCSGLAYANELILSEQQRKDLGKILVVQAQVMKSWNKYAVHIIEPVLNIIESAIDSHHLLKSGGLTHLSVHCQSGALLSFVTHESAELPVEIKVYGEHGFVLLKPTDTYKAFKSALSHFIAIVRGEQQPQDLNKVLQVIQVIEYGAENE